MPEMDLSNDVVKLDVTFSIQLLQDLKTLHEMFDEDDKRGEQEVDSEAVDVVEGRAYTVDRLV